MDASSPEIRSQPARRGRHALIIGIDKYPYMPANPLLGCCNDALRMAKLLIERFGFQRDDLEILLDGAATHSAICQAFERLCTEINAEDVVVIHFSGHGSSLYEDTIHDGARRTYETLVPHDSGRRPHEIRDIYDYQLESWLERLSTQTPNVTLIFDSCHAGGATREAGRRFAPAAVIVAREVSRSRHTQSPIGQERTEGLTKGLTEGRSKGPSGWLRASDRHSLFAACRDDERAREMVDPESGRSFGVFTYCLSTALAKAPRHATCHEVFSPAAASVSRLYTEQNPQLEGAWDRQPFGHRRRQQATFLPVIARQDQQVVLDAGKLRGLEVGSEIHIYPPDARDPASTQPLARARIHEVSATQAAATLLDSTVSASRVDLGCRAVEISRPVGGRRLSVAIASVPDAHRAGLAAELAQSPWLLIDASDTGQASLHWLPERPGSHRETQHPAPYAVPQLGALERPTWAAVDSEGRQLIPPFAADRPSRDYSRLRRSLEKVARRLSLLELRHPFPGDRPLADLVDIELLRFVDGRPAAVDHDHPAFAEGDGLGLTIKHRSPRSLYLSILHVSASSAITKLYPLRGALDRLPTGQQLQLAATAESAFEVSMPAGVPYRGEPRRVEIVETLVIVASSRATDTGLLEQQGMRSSSLDGLIDTLVPKLDAFVSSYLELGSNGARLAGDPAPLAHLPAAIESNHPWTLIHVPLRIQHR